MGQSAPIPRRSSHLGSAACYGRSAHGSHSSTSAASSRSKRRQGNHNQFQTLKMFPDGHLGESEVPAHQDLSKAAPTAKPQASERAQFLAGQTLILQLSLRTGFALMPLPVTVLGHGLMDAPPQRPAEEMIEHYAGGTLQAAHELADLAHAEGDQRSRLRRPLLCDVTALSFTRRAARKPKASMASVMCRYQPCQERIS